MHIIHDDGDDDDDVVDDDGDGDDGDATRGHYWMRAYMHAIHTCAHDHNTIHMKIHRKGDC